MAKAQRQKSQADWKGRKWYDEYRPELRGRIRREVKAYLSKFISK